MEGDSNDGRPHTSDQESVAMMRGDLTLAQLMICRTGNDLTPSDNTTDKSGIDHAFIVKTGHINEKWIPAIIPSYSWKKNSTSSSFPSFFFALIKCCCDISSVK